jgi:phosphonate transport system permease protein
VTTQTKIAAQPLSAQRPTKPVRLPAKLAWLAVTLVVLVAVLHVDIAWARIPQLPAQLLRYAGQMFNPPDWSVTGKAISAMIDSVQMAWVGTLIGAVLSLPLAFLAASNLSPRWLRLILRMVFNVIRAVPELVLAVIILSVTGLTPFTGALAIGIHSIGTLAKLTFEAVEGAEPGPMEAGRAAGAGWLQLIRTVVWPGVQPQILSIWLYRFEVNVRASAVLGLIGAGGVGSLLTDLVKFRIWDQVGMLLIVVVAATIAIDLISGTLRGRIVSGRWSWQSRSYAG